MSVRAALSLIVGSSYTRTVSLLWFYTCASLPASCKNAATQCIATPNWPK